MKSNDATVLEDVEEDQAMRGAVRLDDASNVPVV